MLFDSGLSGGRRPSALARNADKLSVDLRALDAVVISHLHPDHVGGIGAARRRTFTFSREPLEPRGVPAYVPADMQHPRASVIPAAGPRVIAPGMAVLPPLARMLFWPGYVTEQVLDIPIRAVIGGLHLPVHPARTPLVPQAVLGNPYPPWRPIGERDVAHVLDEIAARGPRLVALSSHDSTPWTYNAFGSRFGDRYRTLRAGETLTISAVTGAPGA